MWNLDGKGYNRIPVEKGPKFVDFLRKKRAEFYLQLFTSTIFTIALACVYGTEVRGEFIPVAMSTSIKYATGLMAVSVLLIAMAK